MKHVRFYIPLPISVTVTIFTVSAFICLTLTSDISHPLAAILQNIIIRFFVIPTMHILTINIPSKICTQWYIIYEIYQLQCYHRVHLLDGILILSSLRSTALDTQHFLKPFTVTAGKICCHTVMIHVD